MSTVSLDKALEIVMQLPSDQQEMLIDIVRNRQIERQRQEIAEDAQQSVAAFRAGDLQSQTASEVITELRTDLNEAVEE
ncbi:MAG: hypothetical protein GY805_35955 [Chloroflexi bacterium]|nr:hypothetical protein [Chloroflexota bacterium]